ncbi:hypothetical protein ALE3EI_1561 [Constantimarinum furrinae]|uniref:Transporter n=1 Tax=Constantimarinum furrinae TaxID=2562285 RepID=A0A7G8PUV3_9FLAO|nr:hypothetical protein ALE3EI_1561 [Constantimarinum furrinae]
MIIAACVMTNSNAQGISDGLRYGMDETTGTARFNALSGAFGALGGDLSAMAINPAGSAVFLNNHAAISITILDKESDSRYFNTLTRSIDTDVNLGQAGGVFVFNNPDTESSWRKFTIGVNYNLTNNYDDHLFIQGNGNTSIAEYFLAQAQGIPLELLQLQSGESIADLYAFLGQTQGVAAQNAFLGFQSFIIDPVDFEDPMNTQYISNIAPGNFNQEYLYATNGYTGKYTLNVATQYGDDYFFGINLNSHSIDYVQRTFLYETNNNNGSLVNEVGFENNLSVLGYGFSAQIGAIGKISDEFRLGFTYDTPTWYEISEETTQYIEATRTEDGNTTTEIVDPRVLNIFENYNLRTPGKLTASAAYIFGKQGLISFDYSYKNFAETRFSSNRSSEFAPLNITIDNSLKASSTYRVGGEYRINQLSLRGGFNYQESPYKNETVIGDTTGFSLGFGYNFGNYNFDVSYSRAEQSRNQQLYDVGLTDSAAIDSTFSNIVFTLGFNL